MTIAGSQMRRALAIAALGAAPMLSGCVAAAIPVVAGALVGKKAIDGRDDEPALAIRSAPAPLPAPASAGPAATGSAMIAAPALQEAAYSAPPGAIVRSRDFTDGSRVEVTVPVRAVDSGAAFVGPLASPAPVGRSAPAATTATPAPATAPPPATATAQPVAMVAMPSPSAKPLSAVRPAAGAIVPLAGGPGAYDTFARYAAITGNVPIIGSERRSAMLANPAALEATTRTCAIQPAAVMIDLDPAGRTFNPLQATRADPALAQALEAIRRESVLVAWVSGATADKAGAVRKALVGSGLDPAGKDELVLLRFPEERKQTRRNDIAKELCIVAIAGDERADFDELYEYIKDPVAAQGLEPLYGKGWFLIPAPLATN